MKISELLEANQGITDVVIIVRKDGWLLDALHIGLDAGVKPRFPIMVPSEERYLKNYGSATKRESTYIDTSINAWDDGKDYWQIKLNRFPKGWLDLEVSSFYVVQAFKRHHPRAERQGSVDSSLLQYIHIEALAAGTVLAHPKQKKMEDSDDLEGQISIDDWVINSVTY